MKIFDFVSIANVIDLMLSHWEISVLVLLAFIIIFTGLFRGFKKSVKLLIAFACIGGAIILALLAVRLAKKDVNELISIAIAWTPTALFVLIILISTLVGFKRGLRKSLILFTHSLCAAALCISLYFVCIYSEGVDAFLLTAINAIMGGQGSLQRALGVSAECAAIRQVFYEFALSTLDFGEQLEIVLSGSGAYIMTLVDMVYRLAFTVIFYLLYFILIFILYIIYHACYSERKYRRKKNFAFTENKTDCTYKKHPVGGGVVGLTRGLIVGLIAMSFLGSTLFIIAGGTGDGKLKDYELKDNNASFIYSVYRSVESYGAQGIFRVLNSVQDAEDTPYYLFAADLIFSGGLDDELNGISQNIKFRKELGAYTGFARETLSLLMKYGEDELLPVINGENTDDAMQLVLDVMAKPEFRAEFTNLVDNFDAQTYFINFSLSLVNSVVANIDEMSFAEGIGSQNRELVKVLFKQGYLSEDIPDERERRNQINSAVATSGEIPPFISVNKLLTKRDVQLVLEIALSFIAGEQSDEPLELVKTILPEIEKLSIFSSERAEEMNPVLGRLYCLLENQYLTEEGQDGIRYSEVKQQNIGWSQEIRSLIGVADGLFTLYDNVYTQDGEALDMLLTVFDKQDINYSENIKIYDTLCEVISDSALVGRVLSSGVVTNSITGALSGISENVYVPAKIEYTNTYDENGGLISRGEAYQLFYGLRLLGENRELLDDLLNSEADVTELLDKFADALEKSDAQGNKLSDYAINSVLLRSVISSVITGQGGDVLKVPATSLETDESGSTVNLINAPELKEIFDCLPHLIDLIKPLSGEETNSDDIVTILDDEVLNGLLDGGNGIIEGTVANVLIEQLGDGDTIVIPKRLKNFESWVSFGAPGELRKLLSAVKTMDLDYKKLIDGEFGSEDMFDTLNELDSAKISEILNSDVMHYTVSDYMQKDFGFDDFTIIVPSSVKTTLRDDVIESLIDKKELTAILTDVKDFGLNSEMSPSDIVTNLVKNKHMLDDSLIISVSVVNFMLSDEEMKNALSLPREYEQAGTREQLENYSKSNIWHSELPNLVTALDEIFDISAGGEFEVNDDNIKDKISNLLEDVHTPSTVLQGQTKLTVMYGSAVIRSKITAEIDNATDGRIDADVRGQIKGGSFYAQTEVERLIEALNELGITKIENDEFDKHDFSDISQFTKPADTDPQRSRLDVIYNSQLVGGIITHSVRENMQGTPLTHHDAAFVSSTLHIYRQSEIEQLISLLGDGRVDEYELSSVNVLRPYVERGENGEIKSYLISATVSGQLLSNGELKIPSTVKQDDKLIKAEELVALIDAFSMLSEDSGEGKLDTWDVNGDMKVPDKEAQQAVSHSVIMRATLTEDILAHNQVSVMAENVDLTDANVPVLSEEQLMAVFAVVDATAEDGNDKLIVPEFSDITDIIALAVHIDVLYDCDVTRYLLNAVIANYPLLHLGTHTERVIHLHSGSYGQEEVEVVNREDLIDFVNNPQNYLPEINT